MKLQFPFSKFVVTQSFGQNFNAYYKTSGYKGHTGEDIVTLGDKTIHAAHDGYVFSVINKDNLDLSQYRAVYTLIEDAGVFYELSYGHCHDILVSEGTTVKTGDPLATQGNTGNVFMGAVAITNDQKKINPDLGAHLHFQLKLLKPVANRSYDKKYLQNNGGFVFKDGLYFEVVGYDNGYAGCIDPNPFLIAENPHFITLTLRYGSRGEQVSWLQTKLGILSDGIFGIGTDKAVKDFQHAHGLLNDGIVGVNTRAVLNK